MAGWQTNWANIWMDYGLRRGIHSTRGQLAMKWVRGSLEAIAGHAKAALNGVVSSIRELELSNIDLLKLRKNPSSATVSELFMTHLLPAVVAEVEVLKQQAAKGIQQLESERKARADLWDAHVELKRQFESLHAATSEGSPSYGELKIENGSLKEQLEELQKAHINPTPETLLEHLGRLSDDDFDVLIMSVQDARRQPSIIRRKPKISEPGKGPKEHSGPSQ